MWSDNEAKIDLLNVQHLVAAVTGIVRNQSLLPATIGVFGGWGSGKSSLISMVREQLEGDEGVVCVSFNGGLFRGVRGREGVLLVPVDRALPVPTLPRHRENTRLKQLWVKKGLTLKGKPQEGARTEVQAQVLRGREVTTYCARAAARCAPLSRRVHFGRPRAAPSLSPRLAKDHPGTSAACFWPPGSMGRLR